MNRLVRAVPELPPLEPLFRPRTVASVLGGINPPPVAYPPGSVLPPGVAFSPALTPGTKWKASNGLLWVQGLAFFDPSQLGLVNCQFVSCDRVYDSADPTRFLGWHVAVAPVHPGMVRIYIHDVDQPSDLIFAPIVRPFDGWE